MSEESVCNSKHASEEQIAKADEDLIQAARNAEALALVTVLKFIHKLAGVDMSGEYNVDKDAKPSCIEMKKEGLEVLRCRLIIVTKDYDFITTLKKRAEFAHVNTIDDLDSDAKQSIAEVVWHLCQCAFFVFNNVRNTHVELGEHQMSLQSNTNLVVDSDDDLAIGVEFY